MTHSSDDCSGKLVTVEVFEEPWGILRMYRRKLELPTSWNVVRQELTKAGHDVSKVVALRVKSKEEKRCVDSIPTFTGADGARIEVVVLDNLGDLFEDYRRGVLIAVGIVVGVVVVGKKRDNARTRRIIAARRAINEKAKKDAMLGAVTKFGDLAPSIAQTVSSAITHPADAIRGFFRMSFHYGPEDLLQALGHLPLNPELGTTGLSEDQPIVFNDEDEAGNGENIAAIPESSRGRAAQDDELSATAREIAELQAKINALEEAAKKKRKLAEQQPPEEETKPDIIKRMGKKLKTSKEEDGGFVDLTADD